MGKALRLGIISELPSIKSHNNSPLHGFPKIYNEDPTFHNVNLYKENAGLARNFFGVGSVRPTPDQNIVQDGYSILYIY